LLGQFIDEVEAKIEEAEVEEAQEEQAQAEGGQTPPRTPRAAKPPRPPPFTPKREKDLRRALEDEKENARTANVKAEEALLQMIRLQRENDQLLAIVAASKSRHAIDRDVTKVDSILVAHVQKEMAMEAELERTKRALEREQSCTREQEEEIAMEKKKREMMRHAHGQELEKCTMELKFVHARELEDSTAAQEKRLRQEIEKQGEDHARQLKWRAAKLEAAHAEEIQAAAEKLKAAHTNYMTATKQVVAEAEARKQAELGAAHAAAIMEQGENHAWQLKQRAVELAGAKTGIQRTLWEMEASHTDEIVQLTSQLKHAHNREVARLTETHARELKACVEELTLAHSRRLKDGLAQMKAANENQFNAVLDRLGEAHDREMRCRAGKVVLQCLNKIVNGICAQAWDQWVAADTTMVEAVAAGSQLSEVEALKEQIECEKREKVRLEDKASEQQAVLQDAIDNMRSEHTMVLSDWELKLRVSENTAEELRKAHALLTKDIVFKDKHEAESSRIWQERLQEQKAWQRELAEEWRTKHTETAEECDQTLRAEEASWEKKLQRQKKEERERLAAMEEQARRERQRAVEATKSQLQQTIGDLEAQCLSSAAKLEGALSERASALQAARMEHATVLEAKEAEQQALLANLEAEHESLVEMTLSEQVLQNALESQEEEHQDALESVIRAKQTLEAEHQKQQANSRTRLLQRVCFSVCDKLRLRMMYRAWNFWARSAVGARIDDVWASWEDTVRRNAHQRRLAAENRVAAAENRKLNGHDLKLRMPYAPPSPLPSAGRSGVGLLATIRTTIQHTKSASRSIGNEQRREAAAIPPSRLPGREKHHTRPPPGPPLAATFPYVVTSAYAITHARARSRIEPSLGRNTVMR
jgi:hypothetical protein